VTSVTISSFLLTPGELQLPNTVCCMVLSMYRSCQVVITIDLFFVILDGRGLTNYSLRTKHICIYGDRRPKGVR
jgi:hypothetical protein